MWFVAQSSLLSLNQDPLSQIFRLFSRVEVEGGIFKRLSLRKPPQLSFNKSGCLRDAAIHSSGLREWKSIWMNPACISWRGKCSRSDLTRSTLVYFITIRQHGGSRSSYPSLTEQLWTSRTSSLSSTQSGQFIKSDKSLSGEDTELKTDLVNGMFSKKNNNKWASNNLVRLFLSLTLERSAAPTHCGLLQQSWVNH